MTWAATAWGLVCANLHAYLLPEYPDLVLCIGPDEWTRHEGRERVMFLGPGMSVQTRTHDVSVARETFAPPVRGSAPPGHRATWDRICPILCRLAVPFAGSETTADTSPEACENLYERFLAGLNTVAHVRASSVDGAEWHGSAVGKYGTAVDIYFSLRFTVYDNPLRRIKPTSTEVSAVQVAAPSGTVVDVAVPGD